MSDIRAVKAHPGSSVGIEESVRRSLKLEVARDRERRPRSADDRIEA
jgi:hypothetical protein